MVTVQENLNEKEELKRNVAVKFSNEEFSKLVIKDLASTTAGRSVVKNFKQSEVRDFINNYKREESQRKLLSISEALFVKSPHYRRLIQYYSGLATMSYVIVPQRRVDILDNEAILNEYYEIAEIVSKMNIKHEFSKVLEEAFKSDVFYGYIYNTSDDFYIQKISNEICKISSIENGAYNFSIDMSYFESDESRLSYYAKEVELKFREWQKTNKNLKGKEKLSKWVELNSRNTICIKINEGIMETLPPFAGSFDSIFDIEAFKTLRKDKEELSNYMMLTQKLPIRENSTENNDFAIDLPMMRYFHNTISDVLPENVGLITTPMDVMPIKFDKDKTDADGVAKAERDFWSGSGTSQALFSTENNTSQGITMSIKTDEQVIFLMLNQLERWLNRFLAMNGYSNLFKAEILHVTYFSQESTYKQYLEASTYGLPLKLYVASVLGLEPIAMMGLVDLENDVFELHNKLIPLASSHTLSSDDIMSTGGRPTNEESGNADTDETARARDKKGATE